MQALVWEAPRVMNIREQAVPEPGPDEVIVKVAYAGICGSELSGYLGHSGLRTPPLVMGHEFSGTVSALGANVAAINPALTLDAPVTVNPFSTAATRRCSSAAWTSSASAGVCWGRTIRARMPNMWPRRSPPSRFCLRECRCAPAH